MKTTKLSMAIALILGGAMATSVAFAKGKPPPTTEAAQSLSVPAILVGPLGTLNCGTLGAPPTSLVPPSGAPLTGYELNPTTYYWVQKVHTWQAQCFTAEVASVFGAWGDNIQGAAKLSTGSPIRVEIVLTNRDDYTATIPPITPNTVPTLQGYNVEKLQPSTLDRLSAYGHRAGSDVNGWTDIPVDVAQESWVVHDAGMQISVQYLGNSQFVVPLQSIAPEINATGKVVYGYNLRVTAAGTYRIRVASSFAVTFTGTDALLQGTNDDHNAYIDIVVTARASGGGGGGRQ